MNQNEFIDAVRDGVMVMTENQIINGDPERLAELIEKFKAEVHDKLCVPDCDDRYEEVHFRDLTCGWALAQGMSPEDAFDFAMHVRYNTDLA